MTDISSKLDQVKQAKKALMGQQWTRHSSKHKTVEFMADHYKIQKTVEERGAWCAAAYGVAKSWTRLTNLTATTL